MAVDANKLVEALRVASRALNLKAYLLVDPGDSTLLYGMLLGSAELREHLLGGKETGIEVLEVEEGAGSSTELN